MNTTKPKPLSPFSYAMISLFGLLIGISLLMFYVFTLKTTSQYDIGDRVYYILLIPWGLSSAAFLFGAMKSYASYTGKAYSGTIEIGGPALFAILVVVGGFILIGNNEPFSLTVYVHGKGGLDDKILKGQGNVELHLNSEVPSKPIDGQGTVEFKEIPPSFIGKRVLVTIDHPQPYQSTHKDSLYTLKRNGVIYLEVELLKADKIFGEVTDFETQEFLDSVRVSVLNIETYTNKNGWFELKIPPEKQTKFQDVSFDKSGYQREFVNSVPVITIQPIRQTMKKSINLQK